MDPHAVSISCERMEVTSALFNPKNPGVIGNHSHLDFLHEIFQEVWWMMGQDTSCQKCNITLCLERNCFIQLHSGTVSSE